MAVKKPTETAGASGSLNRKDIESLIELVHAKGFEEFELEHGGTRLRLVGQRTVVTMAAPVAVAPAVPAGPVIAPPPQQAVTATSSTPNAPTPSDEDPRLKKVTSPMVGTFYRSSSPGAKPFVEVGDRVDENSILCIIEAMKLMNEIKAEMRGTVRKIMVENAQPVEYGQVLFLIDPS